MTAFILKLIACATMFIDHFGSTFEFVWDTENLRVIGRIAFPIYVYLVSEGCKYSKNIKKYMLRLAIFALISEIPFDLLFFYTYPLTEINSFSLDFTRQNIFFTLFLGVLGVYLFKKIDFKLGYKKYIYLVLIALIIFAGHLFKTDYDYLGVMAIIICSIPRNKNHKILLLYLIFFYMYFGTDLFSLKCILGVSVSTLLLYLYNGEKGQSIKFFFYTFYPAHLLFLFLLYYLYI